MKSLKEIVNFVGIPQGALASARYQYSGPWTMGLDNVNLLVKRGERPASMRNIIQILQNLTPITLEAEIIGSRSGEEPFQPVIRINASGGITWFTVIEYYLSGNTITGSYDANNSGGDFQPNQLSAGRWQLVVTRSGISNIGFVSLSKTLDIITVSAWRQPSPPPPTPPPATKPSILVQANGDGSFLVKGSNFLRNTTVHIRVVDVALTTIWYKLTSTPEGTFQYPTAKICQFPGQVSFSANDGRNDQQDLTGVLWSNTVTTTCPA